jgi:hypothetical protein
MITPLAKVNNGDIVDANKAKSSSRMASMPKTGSVMKYAVR